MRCILGAVIAFLGVGCASVRTVEDGSLYRSGQLSAKQLDDVIRTRGVKTVVNLRGMQPDRKWYRDQQDVCERNGVEMIDVAFDSRAPERGEVAALLNTYHNAPKPILVHSWSSQGSAGLASGIYRAAVLNESAPQARRELAWWQSSRIPVRSLSEHDRFLREWQGERDFFATYQLAGRDNLPELAESSIAVLKPNRTPPFGRSPANGELPPPSLDLFGQSSAPTADYVENRSTSFEPGQTHRAVAWFGRPVEIDE